VVSGKSLASRTSGQDREEDAASVYGYTGG